jgi:hypothetical protein
VEQRFKGFLIPNHGVVHQSVFSVPCVGKDGRRGSGHITLDGGPEATANLAKTSSGLGVPRGVGTLAMQSPGGGCLGGDGSEQLPPAERAWDRSGSGAGAGVGPRARTGGTYRTHQGRPHASRRVISKMRLTSIPAAATRLTLWEWRRYFPWLRGRESGRTPRPEGMSMAVSEILAALPQAAREASLEELTAFIGAG